MIIGIGTDLVSISRIDGTLKRWGWKFKERIFTEGEVQYCERKRYPAPHYAVRFAAKEAFYKALGRFQRSGIRWREVEVVRGANGRPALNILGMMKLSLDESNYRAIHLSMTHDAEIASAIVIIEG